jgi:hypothetical protein
LLPIESWKFANPVTLPPGRAKSATKPLPIGHGWLLKLAADHTVGTEGGGALLGYHRDVSEASSQAEHSSCLLDLAGKGDAAGSGGSETRLHSLADEIAFKTRPSP